MLNFPPAVRIWLGSGPVDLRRSFDGLAEQVRQHLQADPAVRPCLRVSQQAQRPRQAAVLG